jgi:hypothetical protein
MGRHHLAVLAVAAAARAEQEHRDEREPAADRMDHHRSREVVELLAERALEPALDAELLVPGDAFEQRVHHRHDCNRGHQLRIEARALGDAARDDRRHRGGERQQEEELHQLVAVLLRQRLRADQEADPVRDPVPDEEVGERRHREVAQDLHQRVDLVLRPHGAELEEREPGVHRQHHDRADQDEQRIGARLERFHDPLLWRGDAGGGATASL